MTESAKLAMVFRAAATGAQKTATECSYRQHYPADLSRLQQTADTLVAIAEVFERVVEADVQAGSGS